MLIKVDTAPTKLLLTIAAVPIRYHTATVFNHPAKFWQEQHEIAIVEPAELVQPRVIGIHVHQLLTDKRSRLLAHKLLVFSRWKAQQRTVNTPVD
jgi:hypothetical protein